MFCHIHRASCPFLGPQGMYHIHDYVLLHSTNTAGWHHMSMKIPLEQQWAGTALYPSPYAQERFEEAQGVGSQWRCRSTGKRRNSYI